MTDEANRELTPQQARVRQRARHLLHALDQCVPAGTIHALTEECRPAIVKLIREAHTLPVRDFVAGKGI